MRLLIGLLALIAFSLPATAQTTSHIRAWKLDQTSPLDGRSSVSITTKNDFSTFDFHCDRGTYTFHLLPVPQTRNRVTELSELPDGVWRIKLYINGDYRGVLSGHSQGGAITGPASTKIMTSLASAQHVNRINPAGTQYGPPSDQLSAVIENDGSNTVSMYYRASGFQEAIQAAADACTTGH
jgi:hypothetical protein